MTFHAAKFGLIIHVCGQAAMLLVTESELVRFGK